MHGEAQGHDMSVMFGKLQGGGILKMCIRDRCGRVKICPYETPCAVTGGGKLAGP